MNTEDAGGEVRLNEWLGAVDTLKQCLLVSDAPEEVWAKALNTIRCHVVGLECVWVDKNREIETKDITIRELQKMVAHHRARYEKAEKRVEELEAAVRYHRESLTSGRTVCDQVLWMYVSRCTCQADEHNGDHLASCPMSA